MKFGTVVDENKFRINTACLDEDSNILHYELKENESLVIEDYDIAISMNKPQWNGSEWIETEPSTPTEEVPKESSKVEALENRVKELEEEVRDLTAYMRKLLGIEARPTK